MKYLAACTAAVLLVASGCRTLPHGSPDPFDGGIPVAVDDPRVLATRAHLEKRDRRTLLASVRLSLEAPDFRFSRPQRLAVREPADLRVETLALFGQIAAILVLDGARYQLWNGSGQAVEEGAVTRRLLWDVARVDLTAEEAAGLLLGAPQPPSGSILHSASLLEGDLVVLVFRGESAEQLFEVGPDGLLLRTIRRTNDGMVLWDARFADYRNVGDILFAHELELDFPNYDAHAAFRFRSAQLNVPLDDDLFRLQIEQ